MSKKHKQKKYWIAVTGDTETKYFTRMKSADTFAKQQKFATMIYRVDYKEYYKLHQCFGSCTNTLARFIYRHGVRKHIGQYGFRRYDYAVWNGEIEL
jgi:hypothetical protein